MLEKINTVQTTYEQHLPEGSEVLETIAEDGINIHLLRSPGYKDKDRALLEVRTKMRPCAYIGDGNPLSLEVKDGFGKLRTVDLQTGDIAERFLEPGWTGEVPSGVIYWYENFGSEKDSDLVILDTCPDFDAENEPALSDVVERFIALAGTAQQAGEQ